MFNHRDYLKRNRENNSKTRLAQNNYLLLRYKTCIQ